MRLLALLLLVHAPLSYADFFQKIYVGFKESDSAKELSLTGEILAEDATIALAKNDFKLDFSYAYGDSHPDSLFSFQSNQTITDSYKVGLSKSTFRYGTITFEHEQIVSDLSNWSDAGLTRDLDITEKQYETKNSLTYTYEILNEFSRIEEKEIRAQAKYDNITYKISDHKAHYDLFVSYMNTKMRILIDQLYKESKSRAQKRVRTVKKRFRDGLSRRVDLDSALISVLNQDETIIQNEAELRLNISTLEDLLKTKIDKKEYEKIKWTYKGSESFNFLTKVSRFPEAEQLKMLNELSALSLIKLNASSSHNLAFSLSYKQNAVTNNRQDAFDDTFASRNDEKVIALAYSIPIGLSKSRALTTKKKLEAKRNKLRLKNKASELKVQDGVLGENIDRYAKTIKVMDRKIFLMNRIVRENEKLYLRGQVSFEEVLRSEETLITTKISRVNIYALYEGALAQKALIKGSILSFLDGYID